MEVRRVTKVESEQEGKDEKRTNLKREPERTRVNVWRGRFEEKKRGLIK